MSTTPETFGRYQLLKLLARGGMGEVLLARQAGMKGFEKLVVIKRILPHLADDEDFIHMFTDEANIASNLNHPNVVQIYDLGREGDYYYIAMEFIHGNDIRRLSKKSQTEKRPIPIPLACRIIADAAAGLDYAHRKTDDHGEPLGIVHRDISPHNLLVTFDGGVKVIDFGIARARNRMTQTHTGAIKGRFEYMSPEHVAGLELDGRSDLFALGVVLWEMLTDARLFKRNSDTATFGAVVDCKVPAPSTVNPAVPPELDAVVLRALAQLRDDRFPDVGAFRLALEDWISASRQPGSAAHLAAFVRELYADRLASELKSGRPYLEETTGSKSSSRRVKVVHDDAPTTVHEVDDADVEAEAGGHEPEESPGSPKEAPSGDEAGGAVEEAAADEADESSEDELQSEPLAEPPPLVEPAAPASSRRAIVAGLVVGVAVLVAGGLVFARRPAREVVLTIGSTPPGAHVEATADGLTQSGKAPLEVRAARSGRVAIKATLPGYVELRMTMVADGTKPVPLTLQPVAAPARPAVDPDGTVKIKDFE